MSRPTRWVQLPSIPDAEGFAGSFVGTSQHALIVAGGANFAGKPPWAGGRKIWYDTVYVLEQPGGPWRVAGHLRQPRAYGVSVSTPEGVVCAGGGDERSNVAEVVQVSWSDGSLREHPLPPLPRPCAFGAGALVGDTLYVVGGIETPNATTALASAWSLDLAARHSGWKTLPPLPGPGRILPVAAAGPEAFYVFSGASLHPDASGAAVRTYLRDAYAYTPGSGWRRLADLPRSAVAAPSPAPRGPDGRLYVISGDDGTKLSLFGPHHPGFPRDVLAYDPATDTWHAAGIAPFSRATTATAHWNHAWVVPNGERIPGIRSPEVWAFHPDGEHR
ncbi:MAG TPA: hypothetical protein VHE61_13315 [Opitutaceae bacterium]|nr:hypothetical protein [Opitutaceae bacterium]